MKIRLLFFAAIRDLTGLDEQWLLVPDGATAQTVWQSLAVEHPVLQAYEQPPMVAINESYAEPGAAVHDGDEVAFIPPISGG